MSVNNKKQLIMNHFTIKEMCVSGSYPKLVEVPKDGSTEYANLKNLIEHLLNPIREKLGGTIRVTSGYRPPKLNKAVGGAPNSNHLYGCAADIHFGNDRSDNVKIAEAVMQLGIPFDEVICEGASFSKSGELVSAKWIHVALRQSNNRRKFIFTTDFKKYYPLKFNMKITK